MAIDRDATDDFVSFDEWRADVERHAGLTMPDSDGWGACYGAGLTPVEAIECSNSGLHRERVIEYWGGDIELSFTQLVGMAAQPDDLEAIPSQYGR